MKKDTKNIARIEILNYIINFCTVKCFGENSFSLGNKESSFHGTHFEKQQPPIGSLVKLESAPFTKHYLGWLKEIKQGNSRFDTQFLIESIEDGSLCWWSNVGIWHLPLETTNQHPDWKWTDKQFEFKNRWIKNCHKKRDAYMVLPVYPEFFEDGSVILKTRIRYSDNSSGAYKKFDNWEKVKVKDMLEFYDNALLEYEEKIKTKKEQLNESI